MKMKMKIRKKGKWKSRRGQNWNESVIATVAAAAVFVCAIGSRKLLWRPWPKDTE